MTDNDVSRYDLELVRSGSTSVDVTTPSQPEIIYMPSSGNGISNQMVILVLAIILGVVAIVYSRNCNCARN